MIMNNMGGGSSGSVITKVATLNDVYFKCPTQGTSWYPNYRYYQMGTGTDIPDSIEFYFPGKVIEVLSCKYVRANDTSTVAEATYTGDWEIVGNRATPAFGWTKSTDSTTRRYFITELTALIEMSIPGDITSTLNLTGSEFSLDNLTNLYVYRHYFDRPILSISEIDMPTKSNPNNLSNKMSYIQRVSFSGNLLSIYANSGVFSSSDTLSLNVKLGSNDSQGIKFYQDKINVKASVGTGQTTTIDIPVGFDPNVIDLHTLAYYSVAGGSSSGFYGGRWYKNFHKTLGVSQASYSYYQYTGNGFNTGGIAVSSRGDGVYRLTLDVGAIGLFQVIVV